MPAPLSLEIPQLAYWLVRLTRAPGVTARFTLDSVLFAHWYAIAGTGGLIPWPPEVKVIQETQRARKLSFDRIMALLSKVRGQARETVSVEFARNLLEGFEVHSWVEGHPRELEGVLQKTMAKLAALDTGLLETAFAGSPLMKRIKELRTALCLTQLESDVLMLALACVASSEVQRLVDILSKQRMGSFPLLWATTLDAKPEDLARVLGPKGVLRTSGLLRTNSDGIPYVDEMWLEILAAGEETSLFEAILEPLPTKVGAGIPARLSEEDKALAVSILTKATGAGVNLLLYGAEELEKRAMLREVTAAAEKNAFAVRRDDRFRAHEFPTLAFVAQHLLFAEHPGSSVLVIDRPLDVLERRPSEFLRMVLGIEVDSSHIRPFDELVLEENRSPTVWINVAADALSEEVLARFVFHAKLLRAGKAELKAQLASTLAGMKLTKKTAAAVLALGDVSALQLQTARRAAALAGAKTRPEREAAMLQALRRSLAAMQRETAPRRKECVTHYSLEYLNCAGRFGPEKVMKALAAKPKGSLCLYGLPGTGKTEFVEHLAATLGLPLVAKRASDLLSKYVGDNEKNIAQMFAEGEAEEAVLFLDEGDSFLRDRSLARQEWEVTKVNELLQHMERFSGIFIVATNLFKGLDQAALRRFTFKLEFLALDADQRLRMFLSETGLARSHGVSAAQIEAWHTELMLMPQLTAGDFATVKRQILLLDEPLTPDQWLDQLRIECSVKAKDLARPGSTSE